MVISASECFDRIRFKNLNAEIFFCFFANFHSINIIHQLLHATTAESMVKFLRFKLEAGSQKVSNLDELSACMADFDNVIIGEKDGYKKVGGMKEGRGDGE